MEKKIVISEHFITRCKDRVWEHDDFYKHLHRHFLHPDGAGDFDLRMEEIHEFLSDVQTIHMLRSV